MARRLKAYSGVEEYALGLRAKRTMAIGETQWVLKPSRKAMSLGVDKETSTWYECFL